MGQPAEGQLSRCVRVCKSACEPECSVCTLALLHNSLPARSASTRPASLRRSGGIQVRLGKQGRSVSRPKSCSRRHERRVACNAPGDAQAAPARLCRVSVGEKERPGDLMSVNIAQRKRARAKTHEDYKLGLL